MNKQQKKAQKKLKRKKVVAHKKAIKEQKKVQTRQRIKQIKAELIAKYKDRPVISPEQKAEYVKQAKKILGIPEDKEVTFEQIAEAVRIAKQRFEAQGVDIKEVLENRVKEAQEKEEKSTE